MKLSIRDYTDPKHFGVFELANPTNGPYLFLRGSDQREIYQAFDHRDQNLLTEWFKSVENTSPNREVYLSQIIHHIHDRCRYLGLHPGSYKINLIIFACRGSS